MLRMKFNKLYNLIENVFQPVSDEDLLKRKQVYVKNSDKSLNSTVADIIFQLEDFPLSSVSAEENMFNEIKVKQIQNEGGSAFKNQAEAEHFVKLVNAGGNKYKVVKKGDYWQIAIREGLGKNIATGAAIAATALGSPALAVDDDPVKPEKPSKLELEHPGVTIDKVYDALARAETGSFEDPWIRTKSAPKRGSTAYGPVQITGSLVKDLSERYPTFYETHNVYIDRFIKQANLFNTFGKEPNREGYNKKYDYGGKGILHDDEVPYVNMAKDIIMILMKELDYDIKRFIKRWRGKSIKDDPRYFEVVLKYLKS